MFIDESKLDKVASLSSLFINYLFRQLWHRG